METTKKIAGEDISPAPTIVCSGEGRTFWVDGHPVTAKITREETRGAFTLCETAVPPGGGTPPHVCHRADETFYVLDGTFEFLLEETVVTGREGFCAHVPRGACRAIRNVGTAWGRYLTISAPGGVEELYRAMSGMCPETENADILSALYAQHGLELREGAADGEG